MPDPKAVNLFMEAFVGVCFMVLLVYAAVSFPRWPARSEHQLSYFSLSGLQVPAGAQPSHQGRVVPDQGAASH